MTTEPIRQTFDQQPTIETASGHRRNVGERFAKIWQAFLKHAHAERNRSAAREIERNKDRLWIVPHHD